MIKKIFIIAGEDSGDRLGAAFLKCLKEKYPACQIYGVGGSLMQEQGLSHSLFPMHELSVMGVFEILPKIPHFLKRISQTVDKIKKIKPDILLTIDSPDFSFRVQKKVRIFNNGSVKQIHYIAPTVWAWRPGRAKMIAQFLDGIICTFPFEPPYFEKEGLKAVFSGHPVMESKATKADKTIFKEQHGIPVNNETVGLFFGSRKGEIERVSPAIIEAANLYLKDHPDTFFVVPTLEHLEPFLEQILSTLNTKALITTNQNTKWESFAACDKAIAVSGTVGLELSVVGVPHIIAYKVAPLTALIAKKLVTVKYAHLGNLILDKPVVPEFIQEQCTGENLYKALSSIDEQQKTLFKDIRDQIKAPNKDGASKTALEFIEHIIADR